MAAAPELALEETEAREIAAALVECKKHFPVPVPSPKWLALANLGTALVSVYQPKIAAIAARKSGVAGGAAVNRDAAASATSGRPPPASPVVSVAGEPEVDEWLPTQLN